MLATNLSNHQSLFQNKFLSIQIKKIELDDKIVHFFLKRLGIDGFFYKFANSKRYC